MPSSINWGLVSAIVIFASGLPYIVGVWKQTISRPVVTTWGLWLLIGLILFFTSVEAGVTWQTTLFPILMGVINPAIIFILALKFGRYHWSRLDSACVVACIVAVGVWQFTKSPTLAIVAGIIADAVAAGPQFLKNWTDPEDEPIMPWAMFSLASAISLLAVDTWDLAHALYPVYMMCGSGFGLVLPLVLNRIRR